MNKNNLEFAATLLECFLILIFFGLLLPKLIDYSLYYYMDKSYNNSILVYNVVEKNADIISNYIIVFNNFLK
ncbi:endonuclease III [Clostridium sp. JN-1]|jgi:hypothetical protein|uniref:endonuclease III n=1 Tax=Clostridium sp. JN-1 TaxID=2483110 RepID=UPI000F0BBBAA|nr:endonuclease III [Clostridium sp. JN-1]